MRDWLPHAPQARSWKSFVEVHTRAASTPASIAASARASAGTVASARPASEPASLIVASCKDASVAPVSGAPASTAPEPLSTAGVRYTVTPTASLGDGYWRFEYDAAKRAKTVAIVTAAGLDAFAAHGIAAPGAAVDLDAPCSVLAQLGFEGCVGHRGRELR